jgi:hypothetical protein
MSSIQTTITPHNQTPFVTRTYPSENELDHLIANAVTAQKAWSAVSVEDRVTIGRKFMVGIKFQPKFRVPDTQKDEFRKMSDEIPMELSLQMGRYVF